LLGASGGVELVVCMKAIQHNTCPQTINYHTPDPDCDLDYTPNTPRERKLRAVMSNSFGFGGHNASIIAGAAGHGVSYETLDSLKWSRSQADRDGQLSRARGA
jgi:3-oxoacyl-[acyl-carrier-protein] synthase II